MNGEEGLLYLWIVLAKYDRHRLGYKAHAMAQMHAILDI